MTIRAVAIVVPARDEQDLLPGCLEALAVAAAQVRGRVAVHTLVVLDSCLDDSIELLASWPAVHAVMVRAGNVGAARRAGVEAALRRCGGVALSEVWLATTDADSLVPAGWLTGQLDHAADGWEVVVGTVDVADWSEQPASVEARWRRQYRPGSGHGHVHGANLGCTAASYLDVGGWPLLDRGEDVALVSALRHRRVFRTSLLPVMTSARRVPRAVGGFGDHLRALAG